MPMNTNKLQAVIESGTSKVRNLRMYMPVEKHCLVAVTVIGLRFDDRGVKARVVPCDGVGETLVDPLSLVDATPEAEEVYRKRLMVHEYTRLKHSYTDNVTTLRSTVQFELGKCNAAQQALFAAALKELPINKREKYDLRSLLTEIINVRHGLTPDGN